MPHSPIPSHSLLINHPSQPGYAAKPEKTLQTKIREALLERYANLDNETLVEQILKTSLDDLITDAIERHVMKLNDDELVDAIASDL